MQLDVPIYGQQYGWTCLPACIRMVLGYLGRTHDEAEIAEACDTVPMRGTNPANAIEGIQRIRYAIHGVFERLAGA